MSPFQKTTIAAMVCGAFASSAVAVEQKIDGQTFKDQSFTATTNTPLAGAVTAQMGAAADSLSVTNSSFTGNTVTITQSTGGNSGGAAISAVGKKEGDVYSKVTISNTTFTGNSYLVSNGTVNGVYGGAVGLQNTATTLSNVTLSGNTGDGMPQVQGGALYQSGGSFAANGLTVSGNAAITAGQVQGGAISLWGLGNTQISNATFTNNHATVSSNYAAIGGALYVTNWNSGASSVVDLANVNFSGNSVSSTAGSARGGAIELRAWADAGQITGYFKDVVFTNNSASSESGAARGGAINAIGTALVFDVTKNAAYTGNTVAATNGGTALGGFLYLGTEGSLESSATFNVANGATLTIGVKGQNSDSIASDQGAELHKTGAGNLVIHSSLDDFKGAISVSQGSLSASAFSLADGKSTLTVGGATRGFTGPQASVVFKNNAVNGLVTVNAGGLATIGAESSTWVSKAVSDAGANFPANGATLALSGKQTLTAAGGISVGAGAAQANTAAFGANSLLVVDAATLAGGAALTGGAGAVATVDASGKLLIANAKVGDTVKVLSGFDTAGVKGWAGDNLLTTNRLLDAQLNKTANAAQVNVSQVEAASVYTLMSASMGGLVDGLIGAGLNDVNATNAGVRFLSRATDLQFVTSDTVAASTIEGAAKIAAVGGVAGQTFDAAQAGAAAVSARASILAPVAQGTGLWATPLYQRSDVSGMASGEFTTGYKSDLAGVALGADFAARQGYRAGVALSVGSGSVESKGDFNRTDNDTDFWGLNAYASWTAGAAGLSADLGYASTSNELTQASPASLGFGSLKADADASAWSAGLRGEYRLDVAGLDVVASAGLRYTRLATDAHRVMGGGGVVYDVAADKQNLWTFPVGVNVSKAFTTASGWNLRPQVALGVLAAAGDLEATTRASVAGVSTAAVMGTEVLDKVAFDGGLGLDAVKGNLSFGLKYGVQASSNRTAQGVYASVRYWF